MKRWIWLIAGVVIVLAGVAFVMLRPAAPPKPMAYKRPSDISGDTKLHRAASAGDIKKVDALLRAGKDINTGNGENPTPLFNAAKEGRLEMVNFLISKGADVNAYTNSGSTVLSIACAAGNTEIVKTLLKAGADVKAKNGLALTNAIFLPHPDIVRLLLDNGADPNMAALTNNKTPLQLARDAGNAEIIQMLQRAGAK